MLAVGHAEASAEVVGGEVAEAAQRVERAPIRSQLQNLRADVEVQARQLDRGRRPRPLDRRGRVRQVEAELRVRAPGRDRRVRFGADAGRDPQERALGAPGGHQLLEQLDVTQVVDDHVTDAGFEGELKLGSPSWHCRAGGFAQGRPLPPAPV